MLILIKIAIVIFKSNLKITDGFHCTQRQELSEALRVPATNEFFPWKIVCYWTISLYMVGTVQ